MWRWWSTVSTYWFISLISLFELWGRVANLPGFALAPSWISVLFGCLSCSYAIKQDGAEWHTWWHWVRSTCGSPSRGSPRVISPCVFCFCHVTEFKSCLLASGDCTILVFLVRNIQVDTGYCFLFSTIFKIVSISLQDFFEHVLGGGGWEASLYLDCF